MQIKPEDNSVPTQPNTQILDAYSSLNPQFTAKHETPKPLKATWRFMDSHKLGYKSSDSGFTMAIPGIVARMTAYEPLCKPWWRLSCSTGRKRGSPMRAMPQSPPWPGFARV